MSEPREGRCVLAFNPKPNVLDRVRAKGFEAVSVFPDAAPAHAAPLSVLVIEHAADAADVLAAVANAGLRGRIVGALTHSEAALALAEEVARRLGLPSNPETTTAAAMDKSIMRAVLDGHERFTVAHRMANDRGDIADMIDLHGTVVAKPRDGAGSVGVQVLSNVDDFRDANFPLLVEAYLEGPEYSVEALSAAGEHRILGITEKFLFPGTVIESGHLFPARLTAAEAEELAGFTSDFLDLIGVRLGITHTEVKLTPKGPRVIETHTRSGGDHIAKLVPLATGVDPIAESVTAAVGGVPDFELRRTYWATTQYRALPAGKVARVAGLDVARHMPGVNFIESALTPGAELRDPESSLDRVLGVVAIGSDPQEALDNANRALDCVRVEFE